MNEAKPDVLERVVAGVCYLTFGLAGLLYIILASRRGQSSFFRFHFIQSILLGIIGLLLGWTSQIFISIVGSIIGTLAAPDIASQIVEGINFAVFIIVRAASLLVVYGMIWAFLGKYAEIPFISNIVRQQMR